MRAARLRTTRMPRPADADPIAFLEVLFTISAMVLPSTASLCFLAISCSSATAAAKCFRVTVDEAPAFFFTAIGIGLPLPFKVITAIAALQNHAKPRKASVCVPSSVAFARGGPKSQNHQKCPSHRCFRVSETCATVTAPRLPSRPPYSRDDDEVTDVFVSVITTY